VTDGSIVSEAARREQLAVKARLGAASDELFRLLVASVVDYAIFLLDSSGNVATWNIGAERIKGYRAEDIVGRHFSAFYPEDDIRAGKCELELAVAARDGRFEDEGWRIRKDGSRFWANVVITALCDPGGALLGYAKVTRDLTERRRSEDERAARLAAEQANQIKDEFLAMLGHELRNPLAPIMTSLQLIKLRGEDRFPARELEVIERQAHHMVHLVDDLLDVARLSRGKLELKKQLLDVRVPVGRAIETARPLFDQKGHRLEAEIAAHPLLVDGDEQRLTQVFTNLMTNAAKYTDRGGHIRVAVRGGGGAIVVEVSDNGAGIEPELLARMFEPFVQGAQNSDRAAGGLGLGLALARTLVELHDGRVGASSAGTGKGSTFTVHLPAAAAPGERLPRRDLAAALPAASTCHRILLVDDNEDANMLLADVLGQLGHDVRAVGDGPEALAVVGQFRPDLAILDLGLPGMDGYELAVELRRALGADAVRLIALSGYGQPADRARSEAAGFARHLVKPVEVHRLATAIAELER
jgi:PAS domain S-box-containing protein